MNESMLRRPAHRQRFVSVQKPIPVHALVDSLGQSPNLSVLKIGGAGEHPTNKNRRIDGRHFRLQDTLAVLNVEKMAKEAVRLWNTRFRLNRWYEAQ